MHYPVTSGKILEKDTMCEGMGQRLHLSEGDLETIKFMYSKSRPCNLPELINGNHSGYLVQSIFGTKGNFELVVPQGNKLKHYYRDNDQPNYPWSLTASQPKSGGVGFVQSNPTSVTLIQSNFKGDGYTGNLEMIVRMTPVLDPEGNGDWLAHYFLDSKT
ncbi:hypothetical protein ACFQZ1_08680 [Bacillus sp. CGMCC 1.60114]|uniref:hypothetical protein n=1 Tax=unclassified Bacillus (in: firmicutes) TaxID=185979 RepID=UPI003645542B